MAGGLEDVAVIVGLVPMLGALLTVAGDDGDCVVVELELELELDGCCVINVVLFGCVAIVAVLLLGVIIGPGVDLGDEG